MFEVLEVPEGALRMTAIAISADGSVVVGTVTFSATHSSGYRWTRETGVVLLDPLAADDGTAAAQVSANGEVVVGSSSLAGEAPTPVTWRDGVESPLAIGTNAWKSMTATHVNADGSVVAGFGTLANDSYSAFRWTQSTGPVAIGPTSDTKSANVAGLSADGATIVGNLGESNAFIWTKTGGSKTLPPLEGDDAALAQGISADGRTIIGNSTSDAPSSKRVLWRNGAAPVRLDPAGPDTLAAWTCGGGPIRTCTTVSDDGSVIYTQRNQVPVRYTAAGLETFVGLDGKFACLAVGPRVGPARKVAGACFGPPTAVLWDADGSQVTTLAAALTAAGADATPLAEAEVSIVHAASANGDTLVGDDHFRTLVWVARPPK